MNSWSTKALGELCDTHGGAIQTGPFGSQLHQHDYVPEGTPVIMPKDIKDGKIALGEIARIDNDNVKRLSKHKVRVGDIVIPRRGEISKCTLVTVDEEGYICGTGCLKITPPQTVLDATYFRYYLGRSDIVEWLENNAVGATMLNLSGAILKRLPVSFPCLLEQKKIAAVLSAYDDLIENNLERIKLLEEMAQITYEEWFVRMKFPGHDEVEIDSETGLPTGWKLQTLRELTSYINRGVAPKYVEGDGFPVINQKCIRGHWVNFAESRLTASEHKVPKDKLLQPLDILVNSTGTGTLGRVAQLFDCPGKATVDTHVTIVRPGDQVSAYWLGRSLEAIELFIVNLGKGATNQQELGRNDLADVVKLNAPTVELMTRFDDFARPIFETITNLLNQNGLLKEARDILLPRLMTGMIDIDKVELPEALLERINKQNNNETNIG